MTQIRILVVEDNPDFRKTIVEELERLSFQLDIQLADCRDQAIEMLFKWEFDLIVCDLRIPATAGGKDESEAHGLAVYGEAQSIAPGTPVYFLTAYGPDNIDAISHALSDANNVRIFGSDYSIGMTRYASKSNLDEFLKDINIFCSELERLNDVELSHGGQPSNNSRSESTTIRIFARKHRGTLVEDQILGGGLSGSKVHRIIVQSKDGTIRASVIAKISAYATVMDELKRYEEHIAPILDPGTFAQLAGMIQYGCGKSAGIFYKAADSQAVTMFDRLMSDADSVGSLVEQLEAGQRKWLDGTPPVKNLRVSELREAVAGPVDFSGLPGDVAATFTRAELRSVQVREVRQHNDFHGLNVLVAGSHVPIMIDYGDVGPSVAGRDAVTMELCVFFHPSAAPLRELYPELTSLAANWYQRALTASDTKLFPFVDACRAWAFRTSAGERSVYASAYAYAIRQLKYDDTDKAVALSIAESAAQRLLAD